MPNNLNIPTHITGLRESVTARLDKLTDTVPQPANREPPLPFAEYMRQARAYARTDPVFKRQFEQAYQEYEAVQGQMPK